MILSKGHLQICKSKVWAIPIWCLQSRALSQHRICPVNVAPVTRELRPFRALGPRERLGQRWRDLETRYPWYFLIQLDRIIIFFLQTSQDNFRVYGSWFNQYLLVGAFRFFRFWSIEMMIHTDSSSFFIQEGGEKTPSRCPFSHLWIFQVSIYRFPSNYSHNHHT